MTPLPQFVALLRGVNVGKGNRVPMATFRALLEAEGLTAVQTLLNSGNAVFRSAERSSAILENTISAGLHAALGISALVVVKAASEFQMAIAECPLTVPDMEHPRLLVSFARENSAIQGLAALRPLLRPDERLEIGRHAAYLYCGGGILESKAGSAMLGKLGTAVTNRNWATVLRINGLLPAVAP